VPDANILVVLSLCTGVSEQRLTERVKHLSFDQLAKLREGALTGADLLAADDHLAVCKECRERLQATSTVVRTWAELAKAASATAAVADQHVSFETLKAYVDGTASNADRMRLETHFLECENCRWEAHDLKEFAVALQNPPKKTGRYNRYLIFGPIAAALLVGVVLLRPAHEPLPPPPPQLAVSLQDGGKTIGLDRQGGLVGADASADRDKLVAALRDGKISVNFPEGLRSNYSVLLGADSGERPFRVLSPVGEPVLRDRPEFHWEALPQARSYQVQVYDADYQPVASSPQITETSWTPDRPLERGKRYAWQVTAIRSGPQVKAPQPPDAEARFEIVSSAQADTIEQARQASAGHLQLAAQYAQAGLCREALGEIDALERENQGSPLVQQLRTGLTGQCAPVK
jgi:hypothetical protein